MQKSSPNPENERPSNDWLELPDPHGFVSEHYPVSLDAIIKLSEERLPFVTTRPGFHERRLAEKVTVPFEL